jgi:hypothetical protein
VNYIYIPDKLIKFWGLTKFDPALNVVHSELDNFHTISGACRVGRGCVTDVTDGLNFTPQTVSFSQFQNRAISKWPGFETGATERALSQHTQFPFSNFGHKLSVTPHTPVFSHLKNSCDH